MFTVCFKIIFVLVSVEHALAQAVPQGEVVVQKNVQDHVAPTISQGEEIVQNNVQDYLPNPEAYVIGANHTTLVVCRARANDSGVSSLEVKCKGLRHRIPIENLTTVDDNIPSVSTSRLIVTRSSIRKHKQSIICHCVNTTTKDKSDGVVIVMKRTEPVIVVSNDFKPKRNRKKKVKLHSSVKFAWRYENSSSVKCLHDGQLLTNSKERLVHKKDKISFHIKLVLRADEGYYYCRSKSGLYSSWLKLQVSGVWTKWIQLIPCSANCGTGRKLERRICLETGRHYCQGFSIRVVPCEGSCEATTQSYIYNSGSKRSTTINATTVAHIRKVEYEDGFDHENKHDYSSSLSVLVITTCSAIIFLLTTLITFRIIKIKKRRSYSRNFHTTASTPAEIRIETERVTHVQLPDATTTKLHSSFPSNDEDIYQDHASSSHLLIDLDEQPETAEECLSGRSGDVNVSTDDPFEEASVLQRDGSRKSTTSKLSALSSVSAKFCPKPEVPDTVDPDDPFEDQEASVLQRDGSRKSTTSKLSALSSVSAKFCPKPEVPDTVDPDDPFEDQEASVLQRDGSRKSTTSKLSALSSVSAKFCPKPEMPDTVDPDLCAWGTFTEKGGRLTIRGTGVSLYVPPTALPIQTSQVIYIGLMNSKGNYPQLCDEEALLSPVVVCGPDGLHFQKPVYLTVPHNAVMDEKNCWKPQVHSCSTVEKEEEENKWKVMEGPGAEAPFSHMTDKTMQIMIEHFTKYAITGIPEEIKTWIVAFYTKPKNNLDCRIRVYCISATDAAYEALDGFEKKHLDGLTSDKPRLLRFSNTNKDLMIKSLQLKEGWKSITELEKSINFFDIWNGIMETPNVLYVFEQTNPHASIFRSLFDVKQENGNGVEIIATFSMEDEPLRRYSSGYFSEASTSGFTCNDETKYKIPSKIRAKLCLLLDQEDKLGYNDYRLFAEKLGFTKMKCSWLKNNPKIKSPTSWLLDIWENELSDKIPLQHLIEISKEIERDDVVKILEEIPGVDVLKTIDEPME